MPSKEEIKEKVWINDSWVGKSLQNPQGSFRSGHWREKTKKKIPKKEFVSKCKKCSKMYKYNPFRDPKMIEKYCSVTCSILF